MLDLDRHWWKGVKGLKTNSNWSRAIYARLFIPATLGLEDGRVLYLDADTIIVDNLRPLLTSDIGNFPLSALGSVSVVENERLKLQSHVATLNSGVLLIDIKQWLSRRLTERCLEIVGARGAELKFYDQDALSIALEGDFCLMDHRWNVITHSNHQDPGIIHFTHDKPNSVRCKNPHQHRYLDYRQATPWANIPLKTKAEKRLNRIRHSIMRHLRLIR